MRVYACTCLAKKMAPDEIVNAIRRAMRDVRPVALALSGELKELRLSTLCRNQLFPR